MMKPTLADLAFTCYCYGATTGYDRALLEFRQKTGDIPNLSDETHRLAIIRWLNQWGCRQFARQYHDLAQKELLKWYTSFSDRLFPSTRDIWDLTESEFTLIHDMYQALSECKASLRKRGNSKDTVTFGATGATKTLFSIRPRVFAPWDDPMRKQLGHDGSAKSYVAYLRDVAAMLHALKPVCEKEGFSLSQLPQKLQRPDSSVPKLVDEYLWMKITQKWIAPDALTFRNWARWSQ